MNNYDVHGMTRTARIPNRSNHLRAAGNLSYLDFIRLVESVWIKGNPQIPFIAAGDSTAGRYPCIIYTLMIRRALAVEPKPRQRERISGGLSVERNGVIETSQEDTIIYGQRFENIVKFTASAEVDSQGAQIVEELIESFEDFMLEYTPLFKYLGASDLLYNQRYTDNQDARPGEGVVMRSTSYRLTTEKITQQSMARIVQMASTIRIGYPEDEATPTNLNPYEPSYEEVFRDPEARLVRGIFERPSIIDDNRTVVPDPEP